MSETDLLSSIQIVHIEDEMRGAYLDYAMSVIVGRALPDVRDGLKPVHRRTLYAMYDLSNSYNKPYKKSARVVGDVIGKYHPHGDVAVYDTIVRMAQDFSLRYPLVDGQGNFGSVDGDAPAAMRYTEIRMSRITEELLADIDRDTVDFGPNYDDSQREPRVFPARIPNLLINGSTGIAVGMATNIPPHNLHEIIEATLALIGEPNLQSRDLMRYVRGPDFPTGGLLYGGTGLRDAYLKGRGSITVRARLTVETYKGDRERIVVTELPYQVNKARMVEKIADLVREKRLEGIADLRDESDRTGMRVVIELKRAENSQVIINQLYKLTQLQENYGIHFLAIHQSQPRTFGLRDLLWVFIEHRRDVITRRTRFDLKKAQARVHILAGLKLAVENLDEVIRMIQAADNPDSAESGLRARFGFTSIQAKAILEMRLQRLTGLERNKIVAEHGEVLTLIAELNSLLNSPARIDGVIRRELEEIRQRYADTRRTEIMDQELTEFDAEDLIANLDALVSITHAGYVKRSDPTQFRSQHRGGRGVRGVSPGDEDFVTSIYRCNTHSFLLCFTDQGRLYSLKVYKIPEASRNAKGKAIVNLVALQPNEKIQAILPVENFAENEFVVMVTQKGIIKKTALSEFKNVRASGLVALSIDEGDRLVAAKRTDGSNDLFLCSRQGMGIRFAETDVRSMGRSARGVIAMHLAQNDALVAMEVLHTQRKGEQGAHPSYEILSVTTNGYGKRTAVAEYRAQTRGGVGVIMMKGTDKTGEVMGARQVLPKDEVMLVSNKGQMIRLQVGEISEQGRNTQGVRLFSTSGSEKLVSFELMAEAVVELPEG